MQAEISKKRPPLYVTGFDIKYNEDIFKVDDILNLRTVLEIVTKRGPFTHHTYLRKTWRSENTRTNLEDKPDLLKEIESKTRKVKLSIR